MTRGELPRPAWVGNPPIAIDDCECFCHRMPGVYHCVPCCGAGLRGVVKAHEFVGLDELLGNGPMLPEVDESNTPMAWLAWDLAVEALDARAAA